MNSETTLSADERLLHWLLAVARRADGLALRALPGPATARQLWLRAELEFFEQEERIAPAADLVAAA